MNYFAHGRRFIGDPYFLAGTAVPDLLNVVDRRVRVRSKHATPFVDDADARLAAVARGIVEHHRDDAWFHETPAFAELSWRLTATVRDALDPDDGLRPSFLGHILVEILLDDFLIQTNPPALEAYYHSLAAADAQLVQQAVNRMAPASTDRLAAGITRFGQERFLWDYSDDGKLCYRLDQVMRRVGLAALPAAFRGLLADARRLVHEHTDALLTPHP
jgi:hypothetical protein